MADEPDKKPNKAKAKVAKRGHSAEVVPPKREFPPARQPDRLNDADVIRLIRMIAADSNNIVVIGHATKRKNERSITRVQIERCVRLGIITEGPFINKFGNWQMNLTRLTAGEQITCALAIE